MNDEELHKLLKLKNYEQPSEDYFNSFLEEFHQRQRSEVLTNSARGLFVERVTAWFNQLGAMRWVAASGLACAAIVTILLLMSEKSSTGFEPETIKLVAPTDLPEEDVVIPVSMAYSEPMDFSNQNLPIGVAGEQVF